MASTSKVLTFTTQAAGNNIVAIAAGLLDPGDFSPPLAITGLNVRTARLNTESPGGTDYPDFSGGLVAWSWGSRGCYDPTTKRVVVANSPHSGHLNGYDNLLTTYSVNSNVLTVYEDPCGSLNATWPRSFGHMYDNNAIAGRTFYKMTLPVFVTGQGYVQPNVVKFDIDQLTDNVLSAREGGAY